MMRFSKFALAALILSVASWAHAGPEEDKARDLVKKALNRLPEAKSLAADFRFHVKVVAPQGGSERKVRYDMKVARPNRFSFVKKEGELGTTLVSDGKSLTMFAAEINQYAKKEAPKTLDEFSKSPEGMQLLASGMGGIVTALLADQPFERLTEEVVDWKMLEAEEVNGQKCHHLRLVQKEWDFEVWITQDSEPKLLRLRPDLSKLLGEEEKAIGFRIDTELAFRDWKFDVDLQPADFEFKPPAGAEEVENFEALMPSAPVESKHPLVGKAAPKFSANPLDGTDKFKLSDSLGKKVIVLDFWSVNCPPCIEGLPILQKVENAYEKKDVVFRAVNLDSEFEYVGEGDDRTVQVNLDKTREAVREFLKAQKLDIPVLLDPEGRVAQQYLVEGIPQTVLIGRDGEVKIVYLGLSSTFETDLINDLNTLLTESPKGESKDKKDEKKPASTKPASEE